MPKRLLDEYPWPRMMRLERAAAYVDMSVTSFQSRIAEGTLPAPKYLDSVPRWDRFALDAAIDELRGDEKNSAHAALDKMEM